MDPNKKLTKICKKNENENESLKELEIKVDDEKDITKKLMESVTPEELERLRKIFGPSFTLELEVEKPESALGFLPSHLKEVDDGDYLKQKIKNLQKSEETRIKL